MRIKKMLSLLLAAAMVACLLPATAGFAQVADATRMPQAAAVDATKGTPTGN